ncbi:50S ribosomal protein L23 [Candidatus Gottesmanbacteria bacterium]|nr:50S ribosomal protein L23 [Candidatus Gottesmanbacteria bacterium]
MPVLIKPIITEKAMNAVKTNRYTFAVAKEANKNQIAREIKEVFGFQPLAVKTVTIQNKKKAIIKLKPGEKIDLFDITENVKET